MTIHTFSTFHESRQPYTTAFKIHPRYFSLLGNKAPNLLTADNVLQPGNSFTIVERYYWNTFKEAEFTAALLAQVNELIQEHLIEEFAALGLGIEDFSATELQMDGNEGLTCVFRMEEGWEDTLRDYIPLIKPQRFDPYLQALPLLRPHEKKFSTNDLLSMLDQDNFTKADVLGLVLGFVVTTEQRDEWGKQVLDVLRATLDAEDYYDADAPVPDEGGFEDEDGEGNDLGGLDDE